MLYLSDHLHRLCHRHILPDKLISNLFCNTVEFECVSQSMLMRSKSSFLSGVSYGLSETNHSFTLAKAFYFKRELFLAGIVSSTISIPCIHFPHSYNQIIEWLEIPLVYVYFQLPVTRFFVNVIHHHLRVSYFW